MTLLEAPSDDVIAVTEANLGHMGIPDDLHPPATYRMVPTMFQNSVVSTNIAMATCALLIFSQMDFIFHLPHPSLSLPDTVAPVTSP